MRIFSNFPNSFTKQGKMMLTQSLFFGKGLIKSQKPLLFCIKIKKLTIIILS